MHAAATAGPADDSQRRFADLLQSPICAALRAIVGEAPCHLVGGGLRDAALGREPRDLDVVVAVDGELVARRLARRLGARAVALGGDRFAAYRVVAADGVLDIWDRRREPLEQDLRRRDFTIHAFALDIRTAKIVDPLGGRVDLEHRLLRAASADGFASDPLRVLRLCRLVAQLDGFRIEESTRAAAARHGSELHRVAPERIRSELELTLELPRVAAAGELLVELGIYPELWLGGSVGPDRDRPRARALAAALERLEEAAAGAQPAVPLYPCRMGLLLACLHAWGEPDPRAALRRFLDAGLITRAAARRVGRLLEVAALPAGAAERRWLLHRLGDQWPSLACLLESRAATALASGGSDAAAAALAPLASTFAVEIFDPPALLSGRVLRRLLRIEAGPRLGRILKTLRRRQIEGRLTTRRQAVRLARELASTLPEEWPGRSAADGLQQRGAGP